jgi:hypothetical protein
VFEQSEEWNERYLSNYQLRILSVIQKKINFVSLKQIFN